MNCIDLMSKKSKERKTTKLRRKTFKITQNYESDHIIMHCIDLTSKRSKLQTRSNYYQFAPIWRQNIKTIKNVELRRKTFKTTQNYESDQITTDCIDLMAKTSNQRKTTKVIILRWNCIDLTSKRSKQRKITNAIKLRSICIDLTSKLSKMLSYIAKHSKQRKSTKRIKLQWIASIWCQNDQKCWVTSQNNKSNQITMNCIELTSER